MKKETQYDWIKIINGPLKNITIRLQTYATDSIRLFLWNYQLLGCGIEVTIEFVFTSWKNQYCYKSKNMFSSCFVTKFDFWKEMYDKKYVFLGFYDLIELLRWNLWWNRSKHDVPDILMSLFSAHLINCRHRWFTID